MEMKRLISVAIAFAMLALCFSMVSEKADAVTFTDNSTTLTVNAKYPKLYWAGFNTSANGIPPVPEPSTLMGTQVAVGSTYLFSMEYNYSFGSNICNFTINAWHDTGLTGALGSAYPAPTTVNTRNLAFQVDCTFGGASTVIFPAGGLEVTTGPASVALKPVFPPTIAGQEHYEVYIPVWFGPQLRAATVNGYSTFNEDPLVAFATAGTWDFSITVRDTTSAATNISYGEFGIQKAVNAVVAGNPTGNAPPGGNTGWMGIQSAISYSSNDDYVVTVDIDDLLDAVSLGTINAVNVEVMNNHLNATGNSDISSPTFFTGPTTPLYVWGPLGVPIAASNHGTTSIGPLDSNFYGAGFTNLQWRVTVPGGTAEGVYQSEIRITVDNT